MDTTSNGWRKLLEVYTIEELLEYANCDEAEALEFLHNSGYLDDLPDELVPL